jgi:hypothetical protein
MKAEEPNITNKEIAERLNISVSTLNNCLQLGKKEGWLTFEDPFNKIQYEMIPSNIDKVQSLMDAGDQKTIIEVFKQLTAPAYRESQGINDAKGDNMMIAIKIEMPPADQMPVVRGVIIGEARTLTNHDEPEK